MFSVACVKNSVHRGVCLSACWDNPPDQAPPPWEQTPPCAVHAGRYGQQADGMHATGMQSCSLCSPYYRHAGGWHSTEMLSGSLTSILP